MRLIQAFENERTAAVMFFSLLVFSDYNAHVFPADEMRHGERFGPHMEISRAKHEILESQTEF